MIKINITNFENLAMDRVDEFQITSEKKSLMGGLLIIQSVDILDIDNGISVLKIGAHMLGNTTQFWLTFLVGDDLEEYEVGSAWHFVGSYSINWDTRSIELNPNTLTEKIKGKLGWTAQYVTCNGKSVRKHLERKEEENQTVWEPL
jgi:hypothetical protein